MPTRAAYEFVEMDDSEQSLSYAAIDSKARAIAVALKEQKLEGERALLLYAPGLDYITALWGCFYGGVTAVPAYPPDPGRLDRTLPRLMNIVDDCEAAAILSTSLIQSFGEAKLPGKWIATDTIEQDLASYWSMPKINGDTLALLQYTSGSTGSPKGVMLTHQNILVHGAYVEDDARLHQYSRAVAWLPPYHDMGLVGSIIQPMYTGFLSTLMSPLDFLSNPYKWLKLLSDKKGEMSAAPNFAYDLCTRRVSEEKKATLDLSNWKFTINGAEPVKLETMQNFTRAFESCGFKMETFFPCYGLAESTVYVCGGSQTGVPKVKDGFVSCGKPKDPSMIQIRDGEVCLKNDYLSSGYFNKAEDNQKVFKDYFYTGDLGFIENGELFITGRKKDLIIIRGRNYYPQDIEQCVEKSSANVRKGCTAAFSISTGATEGLGLVAELSNPALEEETAAAVRHAVSLEFNLKVAALKFIPAKSIPKTSSGKIQRYACRELVTMDASVKSILGLDALANIEENKPLVSYGLDSLMRQELLVTLNLPGDTVIDENTTLASLRELPVLAAKKSEPPRKASQPWSIKSQIELLESTGLKNPYFIPLEDRSSVNFSNYNYIGLAGHPEVSAAAKEAIDQYGTSVSASRLVSGERVLHQKLEKKIADFIGVEDAIVYVGGHATNVGTISHLFGPGDLILHDSLSHNSILEGCKLSGARAMPFTHNDPASLERLLISHRANFARVLIVIEGVYSMDGDISDLPAYVHLKKAHDAHLMVDEAHSIGVLGKTGRGLSEYCGVDPKDVDFWMGTLSKSLASCGGYIAGAHEVVEYLRYTSPSFVYSVGISPPNAAAALKAFEVLEREPERLVRLNANAKRFISLCKARGINTGLSNNSAVIPIIIGNSLGTLQLSERLLSQGINIRPIIYPAVEEHLARLRVFMTSEHTDGQIEEAVAHLASKQ
ncbi:MAG: aminotransferase class I/II-fold pyridoxal phosphate-dependent enzyme [Myxococcota bacterium]